MILCYCAGPFTSDTRDGVEANIQRAVDLGVEVAKLGVKPIIPHANTADERFNDLQPYEFWINATLELMRRCDAVIFTDNWRTSRGAIGEYEEAKRLGIPHFFNVESLADWLKRTRHELQVVRIEADSAWGVG